MTGKKDNDRSKKKLCVMRGGKISFSDGSVVINIDLDQNIDPCFYSKFALIFYLKVLSRES
jgi:hypothetical protein